MSRSSTSFCFEISGTRAMFATPASKMSGECVSYLLPTYSALVGICDKIYSRPGIKWEVEACRVMNPIRQVNICIKTPHYLVAKKLKKQRFVYTYLSEVRYQVKAHYVKDVVHFDKSYFNLGQDKAVEKAIKCGGERMVTLGRSDCQAFVKPCEWGEGNGYYDESGLGEAFYMFYEFIFKRERLEAKRKITDVVFCEERMDNGIIYFGKSMPKVQRKWKESICYSN